MARTLGKVTLGMMTVFNAEGASFLTRSSPPGWYWYLPSPPPSSQGLLLAAWATLRSEEAEVGDRAATVSIAPNQSVQPRGMVAARELLQKCHPATPKIPLMMARRTWKGMSARALVQANATAAVGCMACPSRSSLRDHGSVRGAQFLWGGPISRWLTYVELRVALRSGLEGLLASLPLVGHAGTAGVPSAGDLGRAQARGGAKGGAADDARHGGRNWGCGWWSGEWSGG